MQVAAVRTLTRKLFLCFILAVDKNTAFQSNFLLHKSKLITLCIELTDLRVSLKRRRFGAVKMAGKAVMHAVQYDSYGGGVAGLKVVYL